MTPVPLRAKPLRRPRETPIVGAIIAALNSLDHVQVWRNNTGVLEDRNGTPVRYGLAVGSSDIIGMVAVRLGIGTCGFGRFIAIEVKVPGKKPTEDQLRFFDIVRKRGGFAACVHSVEEALEAVRRAEGGEV